MNYRASVVGCVRRLLARAINTLYYIAHGIPRFFDMIFANKANFEKGCRGGSRWNKGEKNLN
jgi:hypothetical protein